MKDPKKIIKCIFPSAQSNDGNSDGDIEREENEDVWCTNWI